MEIYVVSDVGGTQIRVASFDVETLNPIRQKKIPTQAKGQLPADRLIQLIHEIKQDHTIKAIAVAAPGFLDPDLGIVYEAPNIPGWENYPLRKILEDVFNIPIFLGNDANLAALGEWKFGAGIGHSNLLYLTISTGIGSGAILDNNLLLGHKGLAGEFGHVTVLPDGPMCGCGKQGHIEAIASGTGILNYVNEQISAGRITILSKLEKVTGKDISQAAQNGDTLAIEAYNRAGYYLGIALANFLHMLNPSIVIFGGGVSSSGELLFEPMRKSLEERLISPAYLDGLTFTTAQLGDDVGLKGALALLVTKMSSNLLV
ncbi:MAG: ROK family protein [Anaerolineaceae bacterium]|nr:ROK family protein [Anaerolineaceae bacterium]